MVNTYKQFLSEGGIWEPTKTANYNQEPSIDDCRYTCKPGFHWSNGSCIVSQRIVTCAVKPDQTVWNGNVRYTQNFVNNSWTPQHLTEYDVNVGDCNYKCADGYVRNSAGTACVWDAVKVECKQYTDQYAQWTHDQFYTKAYADPLKPTIYNPQSGPEECGYKCQSGY